MSMSKNIVVGASGLIGGELYKLFKKSGKRVLGTYNSHKNNPDLIKFDMGDIDHSTISNLIDPEDNVYILSAHSNPSWIFKNRAEAERLNLIGTRNFIYALRPRNPRIIFMSSVEVFDGVKGKYQEEDEPNPLNYYGTLKHEIEKFLHQTYAKSTIVRTGWNIGLDESSRCVVKLTYETLLQPGARMATDNYFSISSVGDTAEGLLRLADYPYLRTLHLCADAVINRCDMARYIIQHSMNGMNMSFSECLFADIPYTEKRGRINDLDNRVSKNVLRMQYGEAYDTILNKIRYIDSQGHT